jgi:lipid-A-disaccharide synthase-like uncharacterized protein
LLEPVGSRLNILVALHTVVVETCACWAKHVRDLRGGCSNLAPVLPSYSLVNPSFCLLYFLTKKDPVEFTFLTNLKIVYEAGLEHEDTYGETFFCMIYVIQFSTLNDDMEKISECFTWIETWGRHILQSFAGAVIEPYNNCIAVQLMGICPSIYHWTCLHLLLACLFFSQLGKLDVAAWERHRTLDKFIIAGGSWSWNIFLFVILTCSADSTVWQNFGIWSLHLRNINPLWALTNLKPWASYTSSFDSRWISF